MNATYIEPMNLNSSIIKTITFGALTAATALWVSGCALFVIGDSKQTEVIERSQRSAKAVVYLFKEELDSSNVRAATDLMVHPSGRRLLAVERYEIQDEVERWRRQMTAKPITAMKVDTMNSSSHVVHVTMDYIKHYEIGTVNLDGLWYVAFVKRAED